MSNNPAPQLELRFQRVRHRLHVQEAFVLEGLLEDERNLSARQLARRISTAIVVGEPVEMNAYEFSALSALMRDSDVSRFVGLQKLKEICAGFVAESSPDAPSS